MEKEDKEKQAPAADGSANASSVPPTPPRPPPLPSRGQYSKETQEVAVAEAVAAEQAEHERVLASKEAEHAAALQEREEEHAAAVARMAEEHGKALVEAVEEAEEDSQSDCEPPLGDYVWEQTADDQKLCTKCPKCKQESSYWRNGLCKTPGCETALAEVKHLFQIQIPKFLPPQSSNHNPPR